MGRLEEAFQEALDQRRVRVDPSMVRLAADFAQILIRSHGRPLHPSEHKVLDEVLAARTALAPEARQLLVGLAMGPQYRLELTPNELATFCGRFGKDAGAVLAAERAQELDLEAFAQKYGAEEALLLLDALFRLASADGRIPEDDVRALESAAEKLGVDGVLRSALFQRYDPRHAAGDMSFPLNADRLTVGRAAGNDIVLPDPQVARHHCTLVKTAEGWRVVDAGSGRPVIVDGQVVASAPLKASSSIRIGPWELRLADDHVKAFGHRSFTALSVRNLKRTIGEVSLLDDASFTVFSGELIALVGPSGAGKTTVINAIAGIAPADTGEVLLGGRDFHQILKADPSAVGIVPQDDLVHPELKVEESLFYSGRLRYPRDTDDAEIKAQVDRVLGELGIEHIRGSRIGDALKRGISGGQRKRVNLGQELLTRTTRVLFLDEPTSGLDPRSAQDIVRQVRRLADDGRIVFLVTHDLTPAIMALVDHLLVMLPGGKLGYFGPPAEACRFFGASSPDLIFDRLGGRSFDEWAKAFKESPDYRKYVATRERLLDRDKSVDPSVEAIQPRKSGAVGQLATMVRRYLAIKLRDHAGLAVLAVQPPLLALLIWLVFPVPTTRLIFMLSLSCLWFGMSIAVRELIVDRTIWRRERKVGVGVTPYLTSKVTVLGGLNALQSLLFTAIVWVSMGLGDYGFPLWKIGGASVLTGFTGMALGLMLSAIYTSSEAAVGMLPLLLIPNICFSSIMVSLRDMGAKPAAQESSEARGDKEKDKKEGDDRQGNPVALALTWVTMERYAFDLALKTGTHLEETSRIPGKWDKKPVSGPLYDLGLKPSNIEDVGLTVPTLIGALCSFSAVFLSVSYIATWRRDR